MGAAAASVETLDRSQQRDVEASSLPLPQTLTYERVGSPSWYGPTMFISRMLDVGNGIYTQRGF